MSCAPRYIQLLAQDDGRAVRAGKAFDDVQGGASANIGYPCQSKEVVTVTSRKGRDGVTRVAALAVVPDRAGLKFPLPVVSRVPAFFLRAIERACFPVDALPASRAYPFGAVTGREGFSFPPPGLFPLFFQGFQIPQVIKALHFHLHAPFRNGNKHRRFSECQKSSGRAA